MDFKHKLTFSSILVFFISNEVLSQVKEVQEKFKSENYFSAILPKAFESKVLSARIIHVNNLEEVAEFLSSSTFSLSFEILEYSNLEKSSLKLSNLNFIFLNSSDDFNKISKHFKSNFFNRNGFFLIIAQNCSNIDAENIFKVSWQSFIVNINILCRDNNTTMVKTFFPFTETSCGNTTSITLNQTTDNLFPEKLNNLFGCPIKLSTFFYPPITMRESLSNGSFRFFGSEMDLAFGLANALNFTINMTYITQLGSPGLLLDNGTATGILKRTIEGDNNMLMGFYYLTFLRTQHMSFTQSHYSIPLIIMIPFGEPLSPFEKLFRPFQNIVWIFLLLTFGSGIFVISIVNCQQKEVRNFIFGDKIKNPYMNLITVFVGGSQHNLPKRNFARSLLMMFMLFCLVQRSIYQSSLYLFLQSDGRNPEVATIDEMMKKHFVFYIRETLEHNIKHMSFYNR